MNDPALAGIPGGTAVLHTHTRRLDYHPHVHVVMPAVAFDAKGRLWRSKRGTNNPSGFLFNHKALARVFQAKLLAAITQVGLVLPKPYPKAWVVDCKRVGSGQKALRYLGRYLYRGVISERDIVACDKAQVTFRYRNSKTRNLEHRTVSGVAFLWLILKHVLPKGFRRARNFGFLHPNSKRLIQLLQYLHKLIPAQTLPAICKRPALRCRCCGGEMRIVRTRISPHASSPPRDPAVTEIVVV